MTSNQWYFIVVTRSGHTFTTYIDGQAAATEIMAVTIPSINAPLTWGLVEAGRYLDGLMDEVEIYNRALSAAEIAAIFTAGSAGKCKDLQPCTLSLETQSTDGTLTLEFALGTQEPATWNVWLTAQTEITRLLSLPFSILDPPVSVPFTIPFVPPLGTVGVLTTLTTPDQGILCSDFATVDTGPVSEDAAAVQALQDVLGQHLEQ